MEPLQGLDQQEVHGKPYGTAPVRIAAEKARRGLGRFVVHAVLVVVELKHEGMLAVEFGKRADPMR